MWVNPAAMSKRFSSAEANSPSYYLRIVHPSFFGESKYRPSEGWIDIEWFDLYRARGPHEPPDFIVTLSDDRISLNLLQAVTMGMHLPAVVVRRPRDQFTLDDALPVTHADEGYSRSGRHYSVVTFQCKRLTYQSFS